MQTKSMPQRRPALPPLLLHAPPPHLPRLPSPLFVLSSSALPSRQTSLGTDSVASLSAQRRRRAREMQYVRDPIDSDDDSDPRSAPAPSSISNSRLDPASARNPSMSQPDYTFEQFTEHLDPTDKLLKRSFEIIIKENRSSGSRQEAQFRSRPSQGFLQTLARLGSLAAFSYRLLAIRSKHHFRPARTDIALARRMARALGPDSDVRGPNASAMNPTPLTISFAPSPAYSCTLQPLLRQWSALPLLVQRPSAHRSYLASRVPAPVNEFRKSALLAKLDNEHGQPIRSAPRTALLSRVAA